MYLLFPFLSESLPSSFVMKTLPPKFHILSPHADSDQLRYILQGKEDCGGGGGGDDKAGIMLTMPSQCRSSY